MKEKRHDTNHGIRGFRTAMSAITVKFLLRLVRPKQLVYCITNDVPDHQIDILYTMIGGTATLYPLTITFIALRT